MLDALCKLYYDFDPNIRREHVTNYNVDESFPLIKEVMHMSAHDYFFKVHSKEVSFSSAKPMQGAKESIDKLRHNGYSVVIVTKQDSYQSKINTLNFLRHYDIEYDDIVFTKDKWLVNADYMIDDNPEFLEDYREPVDESCRILIDAPYNKGYKFFRVASLYDAADYIVTKRGMCLYREAERLKKNK